MSRRRDRAATTASVNRAKSTTPTPVMRSGSVIQGGARPTVVMDDGSVVYAQCICELPSVGQRVVVEFWPPHSGIVVGFYGGLTRTLAWVRQTVEQTAAFGDGEVDLVDLAVTVPILTPGRLIRVTAKVYCEAEDADTGGQVRINDENGDRIDDYQARIGQAYSPIDLGNFMLAGFVIDDSPDVGERFYQATLAFVGDSGSVTALCENSPAELLIEDVGASDSAVDE